ncbi:MAG: hypothetical protein ACYTG0_16880 [Planctomycetota bacterium]
MAVKLVCRACGWNAELRDELVPERPKCPMCGASVSTPAEAGAPAPVEPVPVAKLVEDPNPYASPRSAPDADFLGRAPDDDQKISYGVLLAMSQTRPCVLFLAVIGFLIAAYNTFQALRVWALASRLQVPIGFVPVAAVLYVAAMIFGGACYLVQYGSRIGTFKITRRTRDLEAALVTQRSFWRLIAIAMGILLGVIVAMLALGLFLVALGNS